MLAKTPLRDLAIAWLEQQDPNEQYNWSNPYQCACAKMAGALDRKYEWLSDRGSYPASVNIRTREWYDLNTIARGPVNKDSDRSVDWTYGKFLERLKADA